MGWVLDTTIPDIYTEDTVQGNLHTCFESPYPAAFWYVNQTNEDVQHLGELNYHSPCFEAPYPSAFWYPDNGDVIHGGELDYTTPCFSPPYPYVFWFPTNTPDVTHSFYYNYTPMGAFVGCPNITKVSVAKSVKRIGEIAFRDTSITSVKIAQDCLYIPETTFPEDCEVTFYNN